MGFIFRETSHVRSFAKIKPSRIGEITLLFTDIGKSRTCHKFSIIENMCFNAIRKNKILPKISEFTSLALAATSHLHLNSLHAGLFFMLLLLSAEFFQN